MRRKTRKYLHNRHKPVCNRKYNAVKPSGEKISKGWSSMIDSAIEAAKAELNILSPSRVSGCGFGGETND